jgi:hypothetical protein
MPDRDRPRDHTTPPGRRKWLDFGSTATLVALTLSLLSFYRSYFYVNQQLDVTVTEVSYGTNRGELYMTVAFSNSGNRDAAVLRVEPALWGRRNGANPEWIPLFVPVDEKIALVTPRTPLIVKSGGVEVVALATLLDAGDAERALVSSEGGTFLGVRVASMNSDGNLYLLEHPVARLVLDGQGKIQSAVATIHRTLSAFSDLQGAPPGDRLTPNKKTPFVWADQHY